MSIEIWESSPAVLLWTSPETLQEIVYTREPNYDLDNDEGLNNSEYPAGGGFDIPNAEVIVGGFWTNNNGSYTVVAKTDANTIEVAQLLVDEVVDLVGPPIVRPSLSVYTKIFTDVDAIETAGQYYFQATGLGNHFESAEYRRSKIRQFPIKKVVYAVIGVGDVCTRAFVNPIILKDPDGDAFKETVLTTDSVPLAGVDPLLGTPYYLDAENTPVTDPWFFIQLAFPGAGPDAVYLLTTGPDIRFQKSAGTNMLFQGLITGDVIISLNIGDALYGGINFPETSIAIDNSHGTLNFLNTDPKQGYSGVVRVWRWDPVNSVLVDEFLGVVTDFNVSSSVANISFAGVASNFFDKDVPKAVADAYAIAESTQGDGTVLARYYGRNLNVAIPLVQKSGPGEEPIRHAYWGGWGRNVVTAVRSEGRVIPHISSDPDGWDAEYNSASDYTLILFREPQTDFSGNFYIITADIEGSRPPELNLLTGTEAFANATYWTPSAAIFQIGDDIGHAPDGRRSASLVTALLVGGHLEQTFTLAEDSPNGLYAFMCVKTLQGNDVTNARNNKFLTGHSLPSVTADTYAQVELGTTIAWWDEADANTYEGSFDLGNGWYCIWFKKNTNVAAGNYRIRYKPSTRTNALVWGAYVARGRGLTIDASEPTDDLNGQSYEHVFAQSPRIASTRNFSLNIKELLLNNQYGFGQYTSNDESFYTAAASLFKKNLYCDGPLNEFTQGTRVLNDLLAPLNCRLENRGAFKEWNIFTDESSGASVMDFGFVDDRGLGNIMEDPEITVKAADEFAKHVIMETVPLRDREGNLVKYKRKRQKIRRNQDYGKIVVATNQFIRYERTGDIFIEHLLNKLENDISTIKFDTNEKRAWNLNLDDVITIYIPHRGYNGALFEIINWKKTSTRVTLTCRPYLDPFTYTGDYPEDRDQDITFYESSIGGSGGGSGTSIADSGGDGSGSIPLEGFATLRLRKSRGVKGGQELVITFEDGSTAVIARSALGSPILSSTATVSDTSSFTLQGSGGFTFGATMNYAYAHLKKAAIISEDEFPIISVNGVVQDIIQIKQNDPDPGLPTEVDTIQLYTFQQEIRAPASSLGYPIQVKYSTPTDYTALFCVNIEDGDMQILKDDGSHLRGVTYLSHKSVVRYGLVSGVPYFFVLDRWEKMRTDLNLYGSPVGKFNRFGYPEEVLAVDYEFAILPGFPKPPKPANEAARYPAGLAIDNTGNAWVAFTDSNNESWVCRAGAQPSGDYRNITAWCEGKTIAALAWDTLRDEGHLVLENGNTAIVKIISSSITPTSLRYQIYEGAPVTYSYNSVMDSFYATLYSTFNDLTSTPLGYMIYGPSGLPFTGASLNFTDSNLRVKDIIAHDDEICYLLYSSVTSGQLALAKIPSEVLLVSGPDSAKAINSSLGAVVNADRCYLAILPTVPLDYTQSI